MLRSCATFLAVSLFALGARALPPAERLVLAPDSIKFEKPNFVLTGVTVEPQGFVKAEIMPAKEILITVPPNAKGSGVVMAFGSNRVYVWEVCINSCPAETNLAVAQEACPTLKQTTDDGQHVWAVSVNDSRCFAALQLALAHATVPVDNLRVSFDEKTATEFFHQVLSAIEADPKTKGLKAGYYGPTLQLSGETTTAGLGRALVHAWQHTVGRVTYDDSNLTLTDAPTATETPQ